MSDETDVEILNLARPLGSPEMKTWAHKLMDAVREVQDLHTPKPFQTEDGPTDEAIMGCAECTRLSEFVEAWPCATAIAMGIEEGPLL